MELKNNKYYINGIPVLNLIKKHGAPLYVYETAKMESQYNNMLKAFGSTRVKINYACKANTNINVLQFFNKLGSGLDAVSIQEVQLGLKAGFSPEDIIYTPNCVSLEEIDKAVELHVKINIDNHLKVS